MMSDLKQVLRSLARRPGYSVVVLATLALVIGGNTSIFSLLNGVLLQPLGYADPEELVMLWENHREQGLEQEEVSAATYIDWRERSRTFEAIAAYRYRGHTLSGSAEPERIESLEVSPSLFRVLGTGARLGRTFTDDEERPGNERLVILSYGSWTNRFGSDPTIIDSTLRLDGEPYTVVGVMPIGFQFPPGDSDTDLWVPLTLDFEALQSRPHRFYGAIGRLAPGVSFEQATSEMDTIGRQIAEENPDSNKGWGVTLVPAHQQLVGDMGPTLWVLFGAGSLVLLIGCANVANIVLTRSTESAKDYAIRSAFGARRGAILRLSLLESLVLAVGGGMLGLLVAYWGVGLLRSVVPASVPRSNEIGIDLMVAVFTGVISIASGMVFGLVPAIRMMRMDLIEVLQGEGRGASIGRRARWLSNLLVAGEVALALVLLVGAGLLITSFLRLINLDPGFRKSEVTSVALTLPESRYPEMEQQKAFYSELIERVKTLPGVEAAGAVSALPMSAVGTEFDMPFTVEGQEVSSPTERPRAAYRAVLPGYFRAMRIPLIQGRLFDGFDTREGRKVMLINESLARRYFAEIDPLGRSATMPMLGKLEIVGVVGDVLHDGLQANAAPEVYVPFQLLPLREMHVVVHTLDESNRMAAAVKGEISQIDPEQPVTGIFTIEELLSTSVVQPRFNMALVLGLAFCAVVLAAVGIYGVVSYNVAQRTREIGLRMALGAQAGDTLRLILSQTAKVVLVGVIIGLAGAVGSVRLIQSLLFGVSATDPTTYIVAVVTVIVAGLVAPLAPAIRAARVDPVVALRDE